MSVRKVGNRWQVRIRVGGGQRIERTLPVTATRSDALAAEVAIRKAQVDIAAGRKPDPHLDDLLGRWLTEEVRHQKSAKRTQQRVALLQTFTAGKRLSDIQTVASALKKADAMPATINRYLSVLRRIGHLAVQWQHIDHPPKINMLTENNERHVYLLPEQVESIARQCSAAVGDLVRFAALTGLRRGELLSLRADQVRDGAVLLDARTKTGRARSIPLPPEAARIAAKRLPWAVDAYALRREFEVARKAAGLPQVHFHDLRHTYASWLVQSGQSMKMVKDLLGHTTVATTDRYTHLADDHRRAAVRHLPTIGVRVGKGRKAQAARKKAA